MQRNLPVPAPRAFLVWLLPNARPVGKSSLLARCADGWTQVAPVDLVTRVLA